MNKSLFLILLFFIGQTTFAQTVITDSIKFDSTKDFRKLKIWLPLNYDTTQVYHTVYCFDSEMLFNVLTANIEIYSDLYIGRMPPTIVVGVFFDQRNDDMGISWEDGTLNPEGMAFKSLVIDGIIPKIESEYTVSTIRSIVGHSNSTSYAHFFLWDQAPTFNGYLTLSQYRLPTDSLNFSELALKNEIDFVAITGEKDAEFRIKSGRDLQILLDTLQLSNLNHSHIYLPTADHLTIVTQGIPLGLESLYKMYAAEMTAEELLKKHTFENRSPVVFMDSVVKLRGDKYGVNGNYKMEDIDLLFDLYVELKDSIGVNAATNRYADLFEDSTEYFYEAQCLEGMKAYQTAEKSYLKHHSICPAPGYWSFIRVFWLYGYRLDDLDKAMEWSRAGLEKLGDPRFITELINLCNKHPEMRKETMEMLTSFLAEDISMELKQSIHTVLADQ